MLTFTIPLRNQSLLSLPGANVRVGDVFILLGLSLMMWDIAVRQKRIGVGAMDLMVLTFLVYTVVSLTWTLDPGFGAARVAKLFRNLICYAVIVWEIRRNFPAGFRALTYGAVGSFSYLLIYLGYAIAYGKVSLVRLAAAQVSDSSTLNSWRGEAFGAASFGGGTINALGMWSAVALMLWLGAAATQRRDQQPVRFWVVSIVLITMTLATLSRGTWLGLTVALVAWMFMMRGNLRINRWVIIGGVMAMAMFGGVIRASPIAKIVVARALSSTNTSKDGAISDRLKLWAAARQLVRQNPVLGVGAGGTMSGIPTVSSFNEKPFVHNLYFQISAEFGMLGFFIWASLILFAFWRMLVARRRLAQGNTPMLFRMSSAMVALVVLCLVIGLTGLDFAEMEWWVLLALSTAIPMAVISHSRVGLQAAEAGA